MHTIVANLPQQNIMPPIMVALHGLPTTINERNTSTHTESLSGF